MKFRKLTIAMVAALISMSSHAAFEQFVGPSGGANVWGSWNTNTYSFSTYQFFIDYGTAVSNIQAITTDDRQFELIPNVLAFEENSNPPDPYWINTNSIPWTGNKAMEGVTVFEAPTLTTGAETNIVMQYTVDAFDLDPTYAVRPEIRSFDSGYGDFQQLALGDWLTSNDVSSATQELSIAFSSGYTPGRRIQVVFVMGGQLANPTNVASYGSATVTFKEVIIDSGDTNAPAQPQIYAAVAASDNKIQVSSTTVIDDLVAVQYQFSNTVDNTFSAWSSETNWVEGGLTAGTPYTYRVRARDVSANLNTTDWSDPVTTNTLATSTALPSPAPAIFFGDVSSQSVSLKTSTSEDALGGFVEYQFSNSVDNTASEWQTSTNYIQTSRAAGTNYFYFVRARDLDASTNTTAWSAAFEVTTLNYPVSVALTNTLKGFEGTSNEDELVHEILKATYAFANYANLDSSVLFDANGATFGGESKGNSGRNIMRTLANTYANQDFEAYITVDADSWVPTEGEPIDGVGASVVFIGFGPGESGAFGVPDHSNNGASDSASFICQITGDTAGIWSQTNNTPSNDTFTAEQPITLLPSDVQRIKLAFDFDTQLATLSIDSSYDGSTFISDYSVGPVAVPDFSVSPSSIYIGGDDGVLLSDFEIVGGLPFLEGVVDLQILSSGNLQWTGVDLQKYDVEYKTALTNETWSVDSTTNGVGTITITPVITGDEVFFRVSTDYDL